MCCAQCKVVGTYASVLGTIVISTGDKPNKAKKNWTAGGGRAWAQAQPSESAARMLIHNAMLPQICIIISVVALCSLQQNFVTYIFPFTLYVSETINALNQVGLFHLEPEGSVAKQIYLPCKWGLSGLSPGNNLLTASISMYLKIESYIYSMYLPIGCNQ